MVVHAVTKKKKHVSLLALPDLRVLSIWRATTTLYIYGKKYLGNFMFARGDDFDGVV